MSASAFVGRLVIQGWSPLHACSLMLHQLISGRNLIPLPRSLMLGARARAPRGMGPILIRGVSQPCPATVTHPPWNWQVLLAFKFGGGSARVADAGVGSARLEHGAGWHQAGFEIAPQRHQELACERHDGDTPHAPLAIADALAEGDAQGAVGLIAQPHPRQFDHGRTGFGIAGLADALVAVGRPATEWTRRQSDIAADLAAVVERSIEHLADQCGGKLRSD